MSRGLGSVGLKVKEIREREGGQPGANKILNWDMSHRATRKVMSEKDCGKRKMMRDRVPDQL